MVKVNFGKDRSPEYTAYILSPKWKARRVQAIARAGGCCEMCGDCDAPLDVHHLTYRHFKHESLDELKAVCRSCHQKIHQNKKR